MLKNLKMLLSLRAWLKSRTLNFAAILGGLASLDLATGSGWVQAFVDFTANSFGWMEGTALSVLLVVKSLADAVLRAKTDAGLKDKAQS